MHIHGSFSLAAPSSSPSSKNIQWTSDGQLVFLTKATVYILTLGLGLSYDDGAILTETENEINRGPQSAIRGSLSWFKTGIPVPNQAAHIWSTQSTHWGVSSLGSADLTWRALTIGPQEIGCPICALNSNMELSLWTAPKNHLSGEWLKIQDVTTTLQESINDVDEEEMDPLIITLTRVLMAQILCLEWSSQSLFDFKTSTSPYLDASLLAVGSRAGIVTFFRYNRLQNALETVHSLRVAEDWIIHISWSSWTKCGHGKSKAYVACATSSGSVMILVVSQEIISGLEARLAVSFLDTSSSPPTHDQRAITGMEWMHVHNQTSVLIYSKPGTVSFFAPSPSSNEIASSLQWSGLRSVTLDLQRTSKAATNFSPAVGYVHINHKDAILVASFDGTIHTIINISSGPQLSMIPTENDASMEVDEINFMPNSATLSVRLRQTLKETEGRKIEFDEVGRIYGFAGYGGLGTVVWGYEICNPHNFEYFRDGQRRSTLVLADVLDDGNGWLDMLENISSNPGRVMTLGINRLLGPMLLHLPSILTTSRGVECFTSFCSHPLSTPHSTNPWPAYVTMSSYDEHDIRNSFEAAFHRNESLLVLRMQLMLAMHCQRFSIAKDVIELFSQHARARILDLESVKLEIILDHLLALRDVLQETDAPFVQHVKLLSSHPELAQRLRDKGSMLPENAAAAGELCPACSAEVPMTDAMTAKCDNGHLWTRCSATSFVLSTPYVRTCVGCGRKALLGLSVLSGGELEKSLQPIFAKESIVVKALLEAVRGCLYCGNRFVRVL